MPKQELGRRAFLVGTGCTALALLGACGSSQTPSGTEQNGQDLPEGVLARTADVPVGGGVVSNGILVMQLSEGQFTAYNASCPHQGFLVQPPSNGTITCPGHNSHFNASDGAVIDGPATRGLVLIAVKVSGTDVIRA